MPDESFPPPKPPTPFIGRERELDWLRENTRERSYGRPIVITGPTGIGKTALAANYIDKIHPSVVINGEFTVGRDSPLARPRGAEKAPYTKAGPGRGEASGAIWVAARTFSEDRHEFEEFMRSRFEDRFDRDLVVLDGADEESGDSRERAVYRILNFKRVRTLIVTSRNDLELRGERTLRLESLPQDDAQKLVKSLAELDSGSIGKILDLAGGRPLLLNMMATLAQSMSSEDLRKVLSGEAYRLQNDAYHSRLVGAAKPLIISANEAIPRWTSENRPYVDT